MIAIKCFERVADALQALRWSHVDGVRRSLRARHEFVDAGREAAVDQLGERVGEACGLKPLSFAISIREATAAQLCSPSSLPAKSGFFLFNAIGLFYCSTCSSAFLPRVSSSIAEPEETGRPGFHPSTMLRIYLYGYLNQVQSSRRMERKCARNLELMWLTGQL